MASISRGSDKDHNYYTSRPLGDRGFFYRQGGRISHSPRFVTGRRRAEVVKTVVK